MPKLQSLGVILLIRNFSTSFDTHRARIGTGSLRLLATSQLSWMAVTTTTTLDNLSFLYSPFTLFFPFLFLAIPTPTFHTHTLIAPPLRPHPYVMRQTLEFRVLDVGWRSIQYSDGESKFCTLWSCSITNEWTYGIDPWRPENTEMLQTRKRIKDYRQQIWRCSIRPNNEWDKQPRKSLYEANTPTKRGATSTNTHMA